MQKALFTVVLNDILLASLLCTVTYFEFKMDVIYLVLTGMGGMVVLNFWVFFNAGSLLQGSSAIGNVVLTVGLAMVTYIAWDLRLWEKSAVYSWTIIRQPWFLAGAIIPTIIGILFSLGMIIYTGRNLMKGR